MIIYVVGSYPPVSQIDSLVDVLHDVSRPGQLDLQLPPMLDKEIHQSPRDSGGSVEEKCRDPQDGVVQLLQTEEEVVPVLHGQQVVVVLLQDAGVKGGHVGPSPDVLSEDLSGRKVAAEHKVKLLDLGAAARASEDATVAHHGADVVVLAHDGRGLREERAKVLANGVDVLVAGVVIVHQLSNPDRRSCQCEVAWNVNMLGNIFSANSQHTKTQQF